MDGSRRHRAPHQEKQEELQKEKIMRMPSEKRSNIFMMSYAMIGHMTHQPHSSILDY